MWIERLCVINIKVPKSVKISSLLLMTQTAVSKDSLYFSGNLHLLLARAFHNTACDAGIK